MPLITGEPPTAVITIEFVPNQGYKKNERVIETALNNPK
jgi:hypothetical protein